MSHRFPLAVEGELELLLRATAGGSASGQSPEGPTDGAWSWQKKARPDTPAQCRDLERPNVAHPLSIETGLTAPPKQTGWYPGGILIAHAL